MSTVDSAAVFLALQQTMEEERRKQIEAVEGKKPVRLKQPIQQEVESASTAYAATQMLKTSR